MDYEWKNMDGSKKRTINSEQLQCLIYYIYSRIQKMFLLYRTEYDNCPGFIAYHSEDNLPVKWGNGLVKISLINCGGKYYIRYLFHDMSFINGADHPTLMHHIIKRTSNFNDIPEDILAYYNYSLPQLKKMSEKSSKPFNSSSEKLYYQSRVNKVQKRKNGSIIVVSQDKGTYSVVKPTKLIIPEPPPSKAKIKQPSYYSEKKIPQVPYPIQVKEKKITTKAKPVKKKETPVINSNNQKILKNSRVLMNIGAGDFVVRTNVFRCLNKSHTMLEVTGIITVLNKLGGRHTERLTAVYCEECGCFFIMMSEYKRVRKLGILLCKMVEIDEFLRYGLQAFNMKYESILKQHGYNVIASVGLSDQLRQSILAELIDNNVLTASQIISYIDSFIATKASLKQYQLAINKWKADREFVQKYNTGSQKRIYVKSIKVKTYHRV